MIVRLGLKLRLLLHVGILFNHSGGGSLRLLLLLGLLLFLFLVLLRAVNVLLLQKGERFLLLMKEPGEGAQETHDEVLVLCVQFLFAVATLEVERLVDSGEEERVDEEQAGRALIVRISNVICAISCSLSSSRAVDFRGADYGIQCACTVAPFAVEMLPPEDLRFEVHDATS